MPRCKGKGAFFQGADAVDSFYLKIGEGSTSYEARARHAIEKMWTECSQFLDENACVRAAKHDFCAVWWELYLAYALHRSGTPLVPTVERAHRGKGRPDLMADSPRTWIEAVAPTAGGGEDKLEEPLVDKVSTVPTEGFMLRLINAVDKKVAKLQDYISQGTIALSDATIIAVSGARLPFRHNEGAIPTVVRTLLACGSPALRIDTATPEIVDRYIEVQTRVAKKSGFFVRTDGFLQANWSHVSAVIYSHADWVPYDSLPGEEFILVHNPNALVPIAETWLPTGRQYWIDITSGTLRWKDADGPASEGAR